MLKSIKRLLLTATAVAAVIVPAAASARQIVDEPWTAPAATPQTAAPAPPAHQVSASSTSFSWHDAGFGAAGMLVVVAVGVGATLAVRRRAILS